jgi:predicted transcriptional regulator
MSQITPRLADARRALDAADRVRADGQALVDEGRQLAKQGSERIRSADPQYWTAARLVHDELTQTPLTQQEAADMLGRSRSYVSRLYSIGKTFNGRDPQAEGLSFDAAYRQAQEVSDYGIGREKLSTLLDSAPSSLTQSELAAETGLAQSTISEYLKQMITEGQVQKGPGRPARYELAPDRPSDVRHEQPIEDGQPNSRDSGGTDDHAHDDTGTDPGEPLGNEDTRQRSDVREMLAFLDRRVHREIKSRRVVPTPAQARQLIEEMSGAIAALRDQATITIVPPSQVPDQEGVSNALAALGQQLRWATTSGQRAYFTDGATGWAVVANTRCAIIRDCGTKITACPSDVTAGWLLTKATS